MSLRALIWVIAYNCVIFGTSKIEVEAFQLLEKKLFPHVNIALLTLNRTSSRCIILARTKNLARATCDMWRAHSDRGTVAFRFVKSELKLWRLRNEFALDGLISKCKSPKIMHKKFVKHSIVF